MSAGCADRDRRFETAFMRAREGCRTTVAYYVDNLGPRFCSRPSRCWDRTAGTSYATCWVCPAAFGSGKTAADELGVTLTFLPMSSSYTPLISLAI